MKLQIAHSIHELDEARWDAIASDEIAMTHRWQRVMEAGWRDYHPRYLFLEDAQGPLATAVAEAGRSFWRGGWSGRLLKRFTLALTAPFSSLNCGIMARPGVELAAVLPHLDAALSGICRRERRLLLTVLNVPGGDVATWQARHFLALRREPAAVLALPADYEQYLQTLSAKERSRLRRMRRRGNEWQVTFQHGPPDGDGEKVYPLFRQVFLQHAPPNSEVPFGAEFFDILEREMPGEVFFFRGYVRGELAGVLLGIRAGQTLWGPLVGLRYELTRPSYLYFLLFDEIIRWCLERGLQHVQSGLTIAREKQAQGFSLHERWFCYRAHPQLLNVALRGAVSLVKRTRPNGEEV